MSHQKGSGSTVHPMHTWTSKFMLEVACYLPVDQHLGVRRRYFVLAVEECQVAAIWASAKVDGNEHKHLYMISPLSHLPPLLSQFNCFSIISLPSWSQVQSWQRDRNVFCLHSRKLFHRYSIWGMPQINSFSQALSEMMFNAYQDTLLSQGHSLSD